MARKSLRYKGYEGSIDVNMTDFSLSGSVLFINEHLSYKGSTFEELEADFQKAVDSHREACLEKGIDPPFSE